MGTRNDSTAWLSGIAGVAAGQAEGGVKLMILDVVLDAAGASSINFDLNRNYRSQWELLV